MRYASALISLGLLLCASIAAAQSSDPKSPPSHSDVVALRNRAERCEAGEQFVDEAKLLATCNGQPGEASVHAMLAAIFEGALATCPVPDEIPEASTTQDVLELLELAGKKVEDPYLASLTALLMKHRGKPTEEAVRTQVRASFNAWLEQHPHVKLGVARKREHTVLSRAQARGILDRTRAAIGANPRWKEWHAGFLKRTGEALDAVIAKAETVTLADVQSTPSLDPLARYLGLLGGTRGFPERDFLERRADYLKNVKRFRAELDDYLTALIASAYGTDNAAVMARLLRAEVPTFQLAYKIDEGRGGNVLAETKRRYDIDRHAGRVCVKHPIVRIDMDDTRAYGWVSDITTHELAHAILQNECATLDRLGSRSLFGPETFDAQHAINEYLLEGIAEFLTQRTRMILAAALEAERQRNSGFEAGVFTYEPLVGLVTILASHIGEPRVFSWYTGGTPTAEIGQEVDTTLESLGFRDDRRRSELRQRILTDDPDYLEMRKLLVKVIVAGEEHGRTSEHVRTRLPFISDAVLAEIERYEAPTRPDAPIDQERATSLYIRFTIAPESLSPEAILALARHFETRPRASLLLDPIFSNAADGATVARALRGSLTQRSISQQLRAEIVLKRLGDRTEREPSFTDQDYQAIRFMAAHEPVAQWYRAEAQVGWVTWYYGNDVRGYDVLAALGAVLRSTRTKEDAQSLIHAIAWMEHHGARRYARPLPDPYQTTFIGIPMGSWHPADELLKVLLEPLEEAGLIEDADAVQEEWRTKYLGNEVRDGNFSLAVLDYLRKLASERRAALPATQPNQTTRSVTRRDR